MKFRLPGAISILFGAGLFSCVSALAGPVVCTSSFEAPSAANAEIKSTAVEVTRCGPVQTTNDLIEQRFFLTAPPTPVALISLTKSPIFWGSAWVVAMAPK